MSSAGDVNGDGFDDMIIGAGGGDASGNAKSGAGESYVIFGSASLPSTIDLATLGTAGITIFGAETYDYSGRSVSSAGDVN
ncbi:MAG: FG-GAP repeat protein, partial [Planctomycetales bacterium]|nr:FG-GAP repeat protein [Planctomycetales bacterium]